MKQTAHIAAVVVTYNRLAMLQQCVRALQQQTAACDILIVDNASTDETQVWAQKYAKDHSNVFYRNTEKNIGGAGGFNAGMRWAAEQGYDFVWLMDDDCLSQADALENLLNADKMLGGAEHYGYLSSAVLWTDGKECKMNRQKVKKSYYEYVHYLQAGLIQVEQSTFVSLFVPMKTIRKVGLPIKEFFIWGDDIEYTRRIAVRHQMPCFMAGNSCVVHAMKENNGSSIATDSIDRIQRYRFAFRNEAYLYRQEGVKGIAYYLAKCGLNFIRILAKAQNHRLLRCRVLLGGMLKGLVFAPKVEMCLQNTAEQARQMQPA